MTPLAEIPEGRSSKLLILGWVTMLVVSSFGSSFAVADLVGSEPVGVVDVGHGALVEEAVEHGGWDGGVGEDGSPWE